MRKMSKVVHFKRAGSSEWQLLFDALKSPDDTLSPNWGEAERRLLREMLLHQLPEATVRVFSTARQRQYGRMVIRRIQSGIDKSIEVKIYDN